MSPRRSASTGTSRSSRPASDCEASRAPGVVGERRVVALEQRDREPRLLARVVGRPTAAYSSASSSWNQPSGALSARAHATACSSSGIASSARPSARSVFPTRVARDLDRRRRSRDRARARRERALECVERGLELAGLVVLPAEVVEQRSQPVRGTVVQLGELEATAGPADDVVSVGGDERDHVRRVGCDEVLPLLERPRESRLEQRTGSAGIAVRPAKAPAFEVETSADDGCATLDRRRLVEQGISRGEVASEARDARELRQDLGAARSRRFLARAARAGAFPWRRGRRSPRVAATGRPRAEP